jgi:hypothetical protein
VRWLVDRWIAKKYEGKNLTEEQLTAEGDKSPGVLMASGYIAGGAIAGIIIAFIAAAPALAKFNDRLDKFAKLNPFANSDVLALIPFAILISLLYLAGREVILAHRQVRS